MKSNKLLKYVMELCWTVLLSYRYRYLLGSSNRYGPVQSVLCAWIYLTVRIHLLDGSGLQYYEIKKMASHVLKS
jgi:hypothetical protein